jgi:GT2 family glycosyltransferase
MCGKMREVSVILPVMKDRRIYRAIGSLLNQDCEIIVVQNGPEKWEELENYCKKNKVKFLYIKEANSLKAYNVGAKHAKGKILVLGDSDTRFSENFIKDVKKHTKRGWITAGCWIIDDFGEKFSVPDQAMFLYKSDFEKIGGYDEGFGPVYGDVPLCLKARKMGIKSRLIPHAMYFHPSNTHKMGFINGVMEARAIRKYPGYLKVWRMIGHDVKEIFRLIRHILGLIVGGLM